MPVSLNSLNADIDVFLKTYVRPKKQSKNIEDDFSGVLIEADLLQKIDKSGNELWYRVEPKSCKCLKSRKTYSLYASQTIIFSDI